MGYAAATWFERSNSRRTDQYVDKALTGYFLDTLKGMGKVIPAVRVCRITFRLPCRICHRERIEPFDEQSELNLQALANTSFKLTWR
jgi:hypothetical protein